MYLKDVGSLIHIEIDRPHDRSDRHPLVIVIHGFTGNMEERHIVGVSRMLNEIGFATLRVDMYGHGSSEGFFYNHTLFKWLTNALTVIDFALQARMGDGSLSLWPLPGRSDLHARRWHEARADQRAGSDVSRNHDPGSGPERPDPRQPL